MPASPGTRTRSARRESPEEDGAPLPPAHVVPRGLQVFVHLPPDEGKAADRSLEQAAAPPPSDEVTYPVTDDRPRGGGGDHGPERDTALGCHDPAEDDRHLSREHKAHERR